MEPEQRTAHAKAISREVVRVTREYTGRGPTKAWTHLHDDAVTVLLADTLTTGERALVAGGSEETVLDTRHQFQILMEEALVEAVQRELGRTVLAFMSANHIDPDLAAETFVLAPR
jgi:uncharacterized protein YbcI